MIRWGHFVRCDARRAFRKLLKKVKLRKIVALRARGILYPYKVPFDNGSQYQIGQATSPGLLLIIIRISERLMRSIRNDLGRMSIRSRSVPGRWERGQEGRGADGQAGDGYGRGGGGAWTGLL